MGRGWRTGENVGMSKADVSYPETGEDDFIPAFRLL